MSTTEAGTTGKTPTFDVSTEQAERICEELLTAAVQALIGPYEALCKFPTPYDRTNVTGWEAGYVALLRRIEELDTEANRLVAEGRSLAHAFVTEKAVTYRTARDWYEVMARTDEEQEACSFPSVLVKFDTTR
jgi:hypothetical protein